MDFSLLLADVCACELLVYDPSLQLFPPFPHSFTGASTIHPTPYKGPHSPNSAPLTECWSSPVIILYPRVPLTVAAAFFLKLMRSEQFLRRRCMKLKTKDQQGTIGFIHPRPLGLSGKFTTTLHACKLWSPWWPVACRYSCIKEYCCAHPRQ